MAHQKNCGCPECSPNDAKHAAECDCNTCKPTDHVGECGCTECAPRSIKHANDCGCVDCGSSQIKHADKCSCNDCKPTGHSSGCDCDECETTIIHDEACGCNECDVIQQPELRLTIKSEEGSDKMIVKLEGAMDAIAAAEHGDAIVAMLDKASTVVLDMAGVYFLSSAGIRILITAAKKAQSANKIFQLTNLQSQITKVLEMSGMLKIITVV